MKPNIKKLLILNAPYLLFVYLFDKVGQAVRLSPGADLSGKLLSIGSGFSAAFSNALPSFIPADLLIGIIGAVIIRLAVYLKGKNAKKYRKGMSKLNKFEDAGTIILEKSLENVSELAKNIKKHFLFRAEQEGKEICLSGNEEIKLLCDRNWIIEAISNLVKNALDHTEKGGLIRIEWRAFTSIVQISVKDNGSGIHPDDLYHIFKRFYRSRFSKDTQGIGLGLSLTKAIVEAHNGTIEVDSTVGMGTSFTINFLNPTKL